MISWYPGIWAGLDSQPIKATRDPSPNPSYREGEFSEDTGGARSKQVELSLVEIRWFQIVRS
jgi:hypothetical protein